MTWVLILMVYGWPGHPDAPIAIITQPGFTTKLGCRAAGRIGVSIYRGQDARYVCLEGP